jgi:dipeptidyl aminopeptidase/acylaminoacyl peptidase
VRRGVELFRVRSKAKLRLGMGALIVVAGFAGLNALAFNHAEAMLRFSDGGSRTTTPERLGFLSRIKVLLAGVNIPRPATHGLPAELAPDCRTLSVPGASGITLASWYCNRGEGTPVVILFHGYSAEKTSLLGEARAFLDLGASVMLVDFRGSGGSSESYTTVGVGEAEDVAAALRYARGRLSHREVFLFGRSMGAAAILRAVHTRAIQPDGVILEAVFDTLLNTARHRFRAMEVPAYPSAELLVFWGGWQWGFDGFEHNPSAYAASVQCPVLLMHGARDPRVRLTEARRVFDAIAGIKEFVTFEQSGHESYLSNNASQLRSGVERFIKST